MTERPVEDLLGEVWWRRKPQKRTWADLPEGEQKDACRRLGMKLFGRKLLEASAGPPFSSRHQFSARQRTDQEG
jgi:hypothetical protein